MPVMSGFEATACIRKHEIEYGLPPVPIIALTAHAMIGYRVYSPLSLLISGKMLGSWNERVPDQTLGQETPPINGP